MIPEEYNDQRCRTQKNNSSHKNHEQENLTLQIAVVNALTGDPLLFHGGTELLWRKELCSGPSPSSWFTSSEGKNAAAVAVALAPHAPAPQPPRVKDLKAAICDALMRQRDDPRHKDADVLVDRAVPLNQKISESASSPRADENHKVEGATKRLPARRSLFWENIQLLFEYDDPLDGDDQEYLQEETGEMELLPLLTEYHELVEKQQQRSSPSLDAVLSNAERLMPGSGTSLRTAFKMKYLVKIFEPFETREEVDAALYSLHCFVQERIDRDNENRTSYSCAGGKQSQSEVEISKRHNLYTRPMLRAVEKKHGPLRIWDLSKIQDLKLLLSGWPHNPQSDLARPHNRTSFAGRGFNEDISQWDVSGATTMELMFYENKDFNQPLDAWNTSRVTNLQYCFAGCLAFDQDIRQWDVSKVTNMEGMFSCAVNFDRDLNGWDVRKVTSMARMFQHAKRFNQALDRWEVGITTNLEEIFHGAEAFNHSLASWIVSGSTNCRQMLATASAFRQLPPQGALAFDIFGPHDESSCSSGTVLISGSRQQDEVTPEAAQLDDGGAQDWSAVGLPSAAGEWWHWFRENEEKLREEDPTWFSEYFDVEFSKNQRS